MIIISVSQELGIQIAKIISLNVIHFSEITKDFQVMVNAGDGKVSVAMAGAEYAIDDGAYMYLILSKKKSRTLSKVFVNALKGT